MTDAVLSIDVSLDQLDVALRTNDTGWQWPHRAYPNNWPGYQQLKQDLLSELAPQAIEGLTAVAESTGPYWWGAFYHLAHDDDLAAWQPQLAVLNPRHVKRFRKALSEQDKSDLLDPQLIDRYYQAVGVNQFYQFDDRYLPLRFLTRAYSRTSHTLASHKATLRSLLAIHASEYQRRPPFSNLFGVTSLQLLDEFEDIQRLADAPLDDLTEQLRRWSANSLADPEQSAQRVQQLAADSYPVPQPLAATLHLIVQQTLAHIRFLSDNQKTYKGLIEQQLQQLPEANPALEFTGLGPILVAGCLSEIQDTRRFISGTKFDRRLKQQRPRHYRDGQAAVAKLAGLWCPQHDSGRFRADDRHLAHERNPYLRYWFVQAAHSLRHHDPDYAAFYWRKFHEVRSHQHKRALTMTARKAVRLIFALLHKGQLACRKEASNT